MLKFAILLAVVAVCYGQQQRTKYFLYRNGVSRLPLPPDGNLVNIPQFIAGDDTIMLIHDHLGKSADSFNTAIRGEILEFYGNDINIIEVDWENDAKLVYSTASARVSVVAPEITTFIEGLGTAPGIHIVGFGLGAHFAGTASRGLTDVVVGRITGLDPSGRGWGTNNPYRLKTSDAVYVEVIHTDGSGLNANGIGENLGQVDIYANGGSNQPGCFTHSCSHNRAYELFAASVGHNLVADPCSTMLQMNLNRCRGDILKIGGTVINKASETSGRLAAIYRINTKRSWPYV